MASSTPVPGSIELPEPQPGFRFMADDTKSNGFAYRVHWQEAESLEAWRELFAERGHDPEASILDVLNYWQKGLAVQRPKNDSDVKDALDAAEDAEDAEDAVRVLQTASATYFGDPPGASSSMTNKDRQEAGSKLEARFIEKHGRPPSQDELDEIIASLI